MIYVDELFSTKGFSPKWPYKYACHLFADSVDELIEFGQKIGMKEKWLQNKEGFVHYDLTKSKRQQAIRAGAKPVTCREMVELVKR